MAGVELTRDQGGSYAAMYNANVQAEAARKAAAQNASTRNVNTSSDVSLREMALKEQQAAQKNAALAAISAQLQQNTGYSAPGAAPAPAAVEGPSPDELAAENAGYGRAKERTGLAMQSAMKGLRGAMASRGIGGSGIEATEMGNVFAGGVGDLAETDRTMAEGAAGRSFTRNEANKDRAESARRYDQDAAARRVSQLLSVYGSAY